MLYHLALVSDWEAALAAGEYRVSTLGATLEEVGFVHACASREQVAGVASRFYAGVTEPLVVLEIDETLLDAPVRYEAAPVGPGRTELFPHIYGPIPTHAAHPTPAADPTPHPPPPPP